MGISKAAYLSKVQNAMALDGIQDWNLFAAYSYGKGIGSFITTDFNTDGTRQAFTAGGARAFADTGTRLSLSTTYSSVENQPAFGAIPIPDNFSLSFDIAVTQPILRNAFGILDRTVLRQKNALDTMANIVYREDIEGFITMLTNSYLSWQLAYKSLNYMEEQLKKIESQTAIVAAQVKSGSAEDVNLALAKQQLLDQQSALTVSKLAFEEQTRMLAGLMKGHPVKNAPDIIPASKASLPKINVAKAVGFVTSESSSLKLIELSKTMAEINLDAANENVKHAIDLTGSASYGSTGTKLNDALSNAGKNPVYAVGVCRAGFTVIMIIFHMGNLVIQLLNCFFCHFFNFLNRTAFIKDHTSKKPVIVWENA